MPTFENGPVTIRYEEAGSGFPMLAIPGGGLNGRIEAMGHAGSFDPLVEFADSYRVVSLDPRNSPNGQTTGPLEADKAWDQFTDDQLALLDHLGIDKFVVTGFCIGGPMIWNLIRRAPDRVVAAILAHPSGFRPEQPDLFYQRNLADWAPKVMEKRPEITKEMCEEFLHNMYRRNGDFVFTVTRDFVRSCRTPVLVMPDDVAAHPFACAMESARLAPNAEVSLYPWREPEGGVALALNHVRTFLKAHAPAG